MTNFHQIVQIYCADSTSLAGSLAAVVSTVKECFARIDSAWPQENAFQVWGEAFLVICHLDSEDSADWEHRLNLIRKCKKQHRFPDFVVISNGLTIEQKKRLLDAHVTEVLESPINLQRLTYLIESRKIEHNHLLKKNKSKHGSSEASQTLLQRQISKIANVETNILLSGETGVGKTYLAEKIHLASKRAKHPFVVVDCASIPAGLIESELFGHAKGAFTDACSKKVGQFEHAGGGTILLDEIDSLTPAAQAKLLRVVEKRQFRRLGENNSIQMKARVISATNLDLEELVGTQQFRSDLFFRLNAYEIKIPNLSQRKQEIEPLCHLFAAEFARENDQVRKSFSAEVMELFGTYDWPGNLRELRNCVFHGAIDTDDSVIRLPNLPGKLIQFSETMTDETPGFSVAPSGAIQYQDPSHVSDRVYNEAKRLISALENNHYNRSLAAQELGVSRMTVYNMLKRHNFG